MFSSWTVTVYNLDWVGCTFSFARITGTWCWLQQLMLEQTNFVRITINNQQSQSTILCESQSAVVARFANHLVPVANLRQISLILFVFVIFWIELSPFWCRHSLHRSRHHRARNRNPAWRDLRTCCSPSPFHIRSNQTRPNDNKYLTRKNQTHPCPAHTLGSLRLWSLKKEGTMCSWTSIPKRGEGVLLLSPGFNPDWGRILQLSSDMYFCFEPGGCRQSTHLTRLFPDSTYWEYELRYPRKSLA